MIQIAMFLFLSVVLIGAGMTILGSLGIAREFSAIGRLVLAYGMALVVLSYALTVVGLLRVLNATSAWVLLSVFTLLALPGLRATLADCTSAVKQLLTLVRKDLWSTAILLGLVVLLGVSFIAALAPPTESDSLQIYLVVPKVFVENQGVIFQPYWPFALPHGMHLVMAFAMILHSATLGVLIYWGSGLAMLSATFVLSRRYLSPRFALLSALIACAMPLYVQYSSNPELDMSGALFVTLAMLLFWRWTVRAPEWARGLLLCGIFLGMAASTKTTLLSAVLAFAGMVLAYSIGNRWIECPLQFAKAIAALGMPTIVLGSFWYVRNWLVAGNPVWPFYYEFFTGTRYLSKLALYHIKVASAEMDSSKLGRGWLDFLVGPFRALFSDMPMSRSELGLTLPAFVPPSILYLKRGSSLKYLVIFTIGYYVLWFLTNPSPSYTIVVLPVLALLAAFAISQAMSALCLLLQGAMVIILIVSLGVGAVGGVLYGSQFAPVVFGLQSRDQFLLEKTRYFQALAWINANLPMDAVVMTDVEPVFYLDRKFVIANIWSGILDYGDMTSVDDLIAEMRTLGVTHVLTQYSFEGDGSGDPRGPIVGHYIRLHRELRDRYLELIYSYEREVPLSRTMGVRGGTTMEQVYLYRLKD